MGSEARTMPDHARQSGSADCSRACSMSLRRSQNGFTLVELVMVIVITGIVASFAVGRFFDRKGFEADIIVDRTKGMLRYAQKLAIAQNRPVFVRLDGA